jgi:hypothetical protein
MLNINFVRDSDREDLKEKMDKGLSEYKDIWKKDGARIVKELESVSGLEFNENEINATVYESMLRSRSFPLSLKASIPLNIKPGLLVHELCHRLLSGNHVRVKAKEYKDLSLEIHKVLNLILYDTMVNLFDKNRADELVEWESGSRSGLYKKAWDWALSFNKKERAKRFKVFVNNLG